jgi:quinoprotein relay system zinc metallohydrolase 2
MYNIDFYKVIRQTYMARFQQTGYEIKQARSLFCMSLLMSMVAMPGTACADSSGVEQIAKGVYLSHGQHGVLFEQTRLANIGFIVGERCIAVIDTGGSLKEGQALASAIKKVSNKPVCYVINTHVHPDHLLGNLAFKDANVEFVGHRNLPRAISILGPTYVKRAASGLKEAASIEWLVSPTRLVSQPLKLDLGDRQLLLTPHTQAHTDNDLTIYDEQTQTLWTGDLLFAGHIPVVGGSGSVNGWLNVVDEIQQTMPRTIVPGHGQMLENPSLAISKLKRYLEVLRDETRAWIAKDGGIATALENIGHSEQGKWAMFDHYHKRNVSYAYTELEWEE